VLLDQEPQQHSLGEVRVLVLVHEHVAVAAPHPLAHVRALVEEAEGAHDEVTEVERAALREQAVVVHVKARELELALGVRPRRVVVRDAREPPRVAEVVVGRDHLVLQPVDPRDEAREQRRRVASRLVVTQGEVVEALEQQGESVGRGHRREEGVDPRLERLVLEQPRAKRVEGRDVQLLVGIFEQRLHPLAHLGGRGR
jgi:hypothetical protein